MRMTLLVAAAAVALRCSLLTLVASQPTSFSYGIDMFNPQEDDVLQVDVAVLAPGGAAPGFALTNLSTASGNYDATLIRNDLGKLYYVMPRYGATACFAFNLTGALPLPSALSAAVFAKWPIIGPALWAGQRLQHVRVRLAGGYAAGAYLDMEAGLPVLLVDTDGDGTQQYVRSWQSTPPSSSLFDVPPACASVPLLPLPHQPLAGRTLESDLLLIESHSAAKPYTLRANRFIGVGVHRLGFLSSLLDEQLLAANVLDAVPRYEPALHAPLPAAVNRLAEGLTTPVREQQSCGGCWTFATTAAIETNTAFASVGSNASQPLKVLAPQLLIDCVPAGNGLIAAKGCNGGWPLTAMAYVLSMGGVALEQSYPFAEADGNCVTNVPLTSPISGYAAIARANTTAIMSAVVEHGSVVAIMQVLADFLFWYDGVYANPQCTGAQLSHAVTIVGYDVDPVSGMEFWWIKNSFGKSWGFLGGYFKMQRGVNMCGIENWASVPIVAP